MKELRLKFIFAFFCLLWGGLVLRLFYIQIFHGLAYAMMAERQFEKKVVAEVPRGEILDRNGKVLASSIQCYSVFLRPKDYHYAPESMKFLESLNPNAQKLLKSKSDFVWVKRKCDLQQVAELESKKWPGIGKVEEERRYYPNGALAATLIGAVGLDQRGLSGIESAFDKMLRLPAIRYKQYRDARGRTLQDAKSIAEQKKIDFIAQHPNSVILTIDRALQHAAERELANAVTQTRSKRGMVLIQNPKTGEILTMALFPSFDPNLLASGTLIGGFGNHDLINPALQQSYEPGSTFKLITFCAALEENVLEMNDKINCENGRYKIGDKYINDHEPQKIIPAYEVLEKSSNVGTAKISFRLGREKLYQYIRAFGFGTRTGVPVQGESEGLLRSEKKWTDVGLANISFGQGIGVSPLQLIASYSAIANGGVLMEPSIVKAKIFVEDGELKEEETSARVVRRVVSEETARTMRKVLRGVVQSGTGLQADVPGLDIAGKTGTAQKYDPALKRYSQQHYVASFCGFFPSDDPKLVGLVILDEPQTDYWASSTAAPVFAKVMQAAARILSIDIKSSNVEVASNRHYESH